MDNLSHVLTAISHPTRRAIIQQLSHGPQKFLQIAEPIDSALNAVTKHLKLLERANLIVREKQGREVYISLNAEPLAEVAEYVHFYEKFWNTQLDHFTHHFREKKKKEKKK